MDREAFEELVKNSPDEALMAIFDELKKAGLFEVEAPAAA